MMIINYLDSISQTEQNNLTQFNNNDILLDSLKFGQKSHFVNTETQITGKWSLKISE